jgi:Flp pilus assembly protein TadD
METVMKTFQIAALTAALVIASPAAAQLNSANDPAPGYSSLMSSNYSTAEREIRAANVSKYDPARAMNLGVALAKQGRQDEAAKQFNHVLMEADVEMVVADGKTVMSHDLARYALSSLRNGVLSR